MRPHDNPDYGVDDSVELFAEDSPTGLIFFAQVKSSSRMSAKLKRSTINYFTALDRPVLVVLHNSESDELFGQWIHRQSFNPSSKTCTMPFGLEHKLDINSMIAIKGEIATIRTLDGAQLPQPVAISVDSVQNRDFDSMELSLTLQARITKNAAAIFVDQVPVGEPCLRIQVDGIDVLVDGCRSTVRIRTDDLPLEGVADCSLLGLGIVLGRYGHSVVASQLFEGVPTKSKAWQIDTFGGSSQSGGVAAMIGEWPSPMIRSRCWSC